MTFITIIIIIIRMIVMTREKEGDTACYRGEALWLDTEGEVHIYIVHRIMIVIMLI